MKYRYIPFKLCELEHVAIPCEDKTDSFKTDFLYSELENPKVIIMFSVTSRPFYGNYINQLRDCDPQADHNITDIAVYSTSRGHCINVCQYDDGKFCNVYINFVLGPLVLIVALYFDSPHGVDAVEKHNTIKAEFIGIMLLSAINGDISEMIKKISVDADYTEEFKQGLNFLVCQLDKHYENPLTITKVERETGNGSFIGLNAFSNQIQVSLGGEVVPLIIADYRFEDALSGTLCKFLNWSPDPSIEFRYNMNTNLKTYFTAEGIDKDYINTFRCKNSGQEFYMYRCGGKFKDFCLYFGCKDFVFTILGRMDMNGPDVEARQLSLIDDLLAALYCGDITRILKEVQKSNLVLSVSHDFMTKIIEQFECLFPKGCEYELFAKTNDSEGAA